MIAKIIWTIILVSAIAAFSLYLRGVADAGIMVVQQVETIRVSSEKRLAIVKAAENGQVYTVKEITVDNGFSGGDCNADRNMKMRFIQIDDSVSVVLLHLGSPNTIEKMGELEIYSYQYCKILIQKDTVTGWIMVG